MTDVAKERMYELDWLRVIAVIILLFFHVGMIFVSWGWHVQNETSSTFMEQWMIFSRRWRMPLLFFISGAGTCFALKYRSRKVYAGERTRRLFFPLLICIPIVVAPQVYVEKIAQYDSFLHFMSHYFNGVYPEGNFSWHHLWFVVYLFIYSLISIPLFFFWRGEGGKRMNRRLLPFFKHRGYLLFLVLPIILSQAVLRPYFPQETHALYNDWAYFVYFWCFFAFGFILTTDRAYWDLIRDHRRTFLGAALGVLVLLYFSYWVLWPARNALWIRFDHLWDLTNMMMAWFWVLTILGYGRRYLAFGNAYLRWANESVYPFYIWHQAVIVIIGYFVIQWNMNLYLKFAVIAFSSFVVSILLTMLVRQTNITRFMFGMRPKPGGKDLAAPAAGKTAAAT